MPAEGGGDDQILEEVHFATLMPDGSVSAWSATTPLTPPRYRTACVAYNGCLYATGGRSGAVVAETNTYLDRVQSARINADGTLSEWKDGPPFAVARYQHSAVAYIDRLYVLGGRDGSRMRPDVQFAAIHDDGTTGPWVATTPLPGQGRRVFGADALDGYLYVTGGAQATGQPRLSEVRFAPFDATGAVGTWELGTSLCGGPRRRCPSGRWM
ncbi:MAG: hypothetical protein HY716_11725 [Planctomycetes bacterium]|nr:hypothetical protein [Planctomycetota bacterium]